MGNHQLLRQSPFVRWRQFGSDGILLDARSGAFLQINDSAVAVWKFFETPATIDDAVRHVCEEFEGGTDNAAADVHEFVAELLRHHFLTDRPA